MHQNENTLKFAAMLDSLLPMTGACLRYLWYKLSGAFVLRASSAPLAEGKVCEAKLQEILTHKTLARAGMTDSVGSLRKQETPRLS